MKNMRSGFPGFITVLLALCMLASQFVAAAPAKKPAQPTAKPVAKPAAKPAPKPATKPAVKGTQQLNGEQAQFGLTYTLGVTTPVNVQLISAEYTVEPVSVGTETEVPEYDEKLMVLHYMIQNPNKSDLGLSWSTLNFTAVDATDRNFGYGGRVGTENDKDAVSMYLKPGQKVNLYTYIVVPATAVIPKLMVEGSDRKVLRYDLNNQGTPPKPIVKPLSAPYADPSDPKGYTALTIVPVQMGVYYHYGSLDIRVDKAEFSTAPIESYQLKPGHRYLNVYYTVKNVTMSSQSLGWSTMDPHLTDADGIELEWSQSILAASRDISVSQAISPKAELKARHLFQVPDGIPLGTLTLKIGSEGRYFLYDLSGVK